jgi:AraC-like DNA-binding protein
MAVLPCRCYVNTDLSGRELASHGSPDFPAACYYADAGFDPVPPHWHNEMEIIVVLQDRMNVHVQMENHVLQAGEGIFINANILHAASQCSDRTKFHSLVFSPLLIAGDKNSIFWKKYIAPVIGNSSFPYFVCSPDIPWQKQLIEKAGNAWNEGAEEAEGYELRMREDLSECLFLLSQHLDQGNIQISHIKNAVKEQRLKDMLTYINTHYSEAITLKDIAASVSISPTECLRCFREGLKQSPIQYTKKYRLIIAARYLKTTDWPISEIGRKCGFQEMGYFASQFKKSFGRTPTEYRRNG